MRDLIHKITQFFRGEDFGENGEDARLELTPAELRKIAYLMTENARLKTKLDKHNKAFDNIKDAISRQAVLDGIAIIAKAKAKSDAQKSLMGRVLFFTERLPSVTPARARGKWMTEHNRGYVQCSNCHTRVPFCKRSNFCPNCGADMRGDINVYSD